MAVQERRLAPLAIARALARLSKLLHELPLGRPRHARDRRRGAAGFARRWPARRATAPTGRQRDYAQDVAQVTAPVQLVGGWYDIFLPWMLEDLAALQAAGRETQLIVGPWAHTSPGLVAAGMREALGWLREHLLGDDRLVRPEPVRDPRHRRARRRRLARAGELAAARHRRAAAVARRGRAPARPRRPTTAAADGYRYDPADPTPSLGGPLLLARQPVVDQAPLEARADVLTYTTAPLAQAAEAIGVARVALHVRASTPHFDVFARVCDVDRDGVSRNVCDALERVSPDRFAPARRRRLARGLRPVADGPPLRGRSPHLPADLLRRAPALAAARHRPVGAHLAGARRRRHARGAGLAARAPARRPPARAAGARAGARHR